MYRLDAEHPGQSLYTPTIRLMTEFIWIILITWRSCCYAQDFDLELKTGVFPVLF